MALPVAPRHEVCPQTVKMSVGGAEYEAALAQRENPFAALVRLKPGKS
jgi:uncharacterized protein